MVLGVAIVSVLVLAGAAGVYAYSANQRVQELQDEVGELESSTSPPSRTILVTPEPTPFNLDEWYEDNIGDVEPPQPAPVITTPPIRTCPDMRRDELCTRSETERKADAYDEAAECEARGGNWELRYRSDPDSGYCRRR